MVLYLIILAVALVGAQLHPDRPAIYVRLPSLRERAKIQDEWTSQRMAHIPALLEKYKADAWLMTQREHAEDTIWWSIKNATDYGAHRRTVVLLTKNASTPIVWVDNTGAVWPELRHALERNAPEKIVLNTDRDIAFAGGLHVGELQVLHKELGERWMSKIVNIPMLAVEYVATRVPGQLAYYRKLQEIVWAMIEEGFSDKVVVSGKTTTEDLEWWFIEKMQVLNVTTWNHPRVSVIVESSFPGWRGTKDVIQEGDILHIDFGITAMGLNTDTQHMAYVLRTSLLETDAPESLKEGMRKGNRMQDILLANMRPGLTGNMVLRQSLAQMKADGIEGQIYSHPIGDWGHDAGAVMGKEMCSFARSAFVVTSNAGFTNLPEYVPVLGELPILANTYYSIELYAYHFVPERNETLRFRLEENAYWSEQTQTWQFVRGRQERYHLIGRGKNVFVVQN